VAPRCEAVRCAVYGIPLRRLETVGQGVQAIPVMSGVILMQRYFGFLVCVSILSTPVWLTSNARGADRVSHAVVGQQVGQTAAVDSHPSLAEADLTRIGLKGLKVADDRLGHQVRGTATASRGWTGGMSFVSAMLYEPTTGSNARGTSTHSSSAGTNDLGWAPAPWPTPAAHAAQMSELNFALTVGRDGQTFFSAAVQGLAGGQGFVGR